LGTSPVVMALEVFNTSSTKTNSRNVLAMQFLRDTTGWSAYLCDPRPQGRHGSRWCL